MMMSLRDGGSCGSRDCLEEVDHWEHVLKGIPSVQPPPNILFPGCHEVSSSTTLSPMMFQTHLKPTVIEPASHGMRSLEP